MQQASKAKKDEFYTQLVDIENELKHYREYFENKTVLCNCDDPFESNFFRYFAINFNFLKLKKLICTCYAGSPISHTELNDLPLFKKDEKLPYKIEITEVPDINGDGATDLSDIEILLRSNKNNLTILDGDGDFRSEESIEFLKEADIVVTNPPFSLFREYITQLIEYDKEFVILGNMNAITYKGIFSIFKKNKVWYGPSISSGDRKFYVPDNYELNASGCGIDDDGRKWIKVKGVRWFTNLDHKKRHEKLILYKKYSPKEFPKYDNYDAININKTAEIPEDYSGIMGVPITFLDRYSPDQFELLGIMSGAKGEGLTNGNDGRAKFYVRGRGVYARILIRRKQNEN